MYQLFMKISIWQPSAAGAESEGGGCRLKLAKQSAAALAAAASALGAALRRKSA